jgi:hypothetical protein
MHLHRKTVKPSALSVRCSTGWRTAGDDVGGLGRLKGLAQGLIRQRRADAMSGLAGFGEQCLVTSNGQEGGGDLQEQDRVIHPSRLVQGCA